MTITSRSPLDLLEPGALLGGALFGSLLNHVASGDRLLPDTRLGPFRVGEEIGRGGMGMVYRAERDDGEYRQTVAIKSLSSSGSAQGLELFRRERQVLAELKHPHIARLLDGGHQADGRLWFAMELIEGRPIDAHARAFELPVAARLRLMRQVIDAVAFAHQRLLIHRDIKPGNVLVDADGSVKLLDFGIAALVGDVGATRAYSPAWASPEQWAGDEIGPASDQFQLGLLLDAVLRGAAAPPTDGTLTVAGATAVIRGTTKIDAGADSSRARRIDPACWLPISATRRAELIAIATRATAEDVDTRYGSVAELGAEIDRWLDLRPVAAYGGGVVYTAHCSVRRHPLIATLALITLVGIAALVAGFSWRVSQERDLARAEAARAEREAAIAQAINQFLNEDLLSAADPYGQNKKDAPIGEVVEGAVPLVAKRFDSQPAIAGEVYRTLGNMLVNLGRVDAARTTLDQAAVALSAAYGPTSRHTVEARLLRAEAEEYAGRYEENERLLRALRADLATLDPRDPRVVHVDLYLAWSAFILGRFDRAEAAYRDLLERSAGQKAIPDLDRAKMLGGRSVALSRLNRSDEALTVARQAHAIRERELGPDHPDTAQSSLHVATALMGLDRMAEAVAAYETLHRRAQTRFGPKHQETLILAHDLGVALIRSTQPADAIPYLEQAVAAKIVAHGAQSGSTMNSISWLGLAYLRAGRVEDAERTFARVIGFKSTTEFDQRAEIGLRRNIGELRLTQGRAADALASCDQGARFARDMYDMTHPLRASVEACRGVALVALGREREGRELLQSLREPLRAAGTQATVWADKAKAILDAAKS